MEYLPVNITYNFIGSEKVQGFRSVEVLYLIVHNGLIQGIIGLGVSKEGKRLCSFTGDLFEDLTYNYSASQSHKGGLNVKE